MKGLVVCPEPRAAEEGSKILARGGNAVDAAVATAFVQAIVNPVMCGVGGFGSMLIYLAKEGKPVCLDFLGRAGSKVTPEMWQDKIATVFNDTQVVEGAANIIGHKSVCTPGTVKGLHEALTKYGTMSWREVIEPAIPYAEDGVLMNSRAVEYYTLPPYFAGYPSAAEILKRTPDSKKIWYKEDGSTYTLGEVRPNKDYGRTLRRLIEEGPDSFYTGSIAREIAKDMEENGGFITADDLKNYRTRTYEPLQGSYRGYQIFTNRPPDLGVTLLELLNILEGYPLGEMLPDTADYNWLLIQAYRAAHADRVQYVGDEEFVEVPVEMLASKDRGEYWRKIIDAGEQIVVPRVRPEPHNTTHLCALDEDGNAVSLTHTNCFNSGCVTPGLGFLYNNAMTWFQFVPGLPNSLAPGKARVSGICPSILFKEGKLAMLIGALGGFAIPSGVGQSILNVIDHGVTMQEAVSAPRIHTVGEVVELEGRVRADVAEDLRRRGNQVRHWPDGFVRTMALAHGIKIDLTTGKWQPGADPRGNAGIAFSHV